MALFYFKTGDKLCVVPFMGDDLEGTLQSIADGLIHERTEVELVYCFRRLVNLLKCFISNSLRSFVFLVVTNFALQ